MPIEAHDSICCGKVSCMYSMARQHILKFQFRNLFMVSNTISDTFRTFLQIHIFRVNMSI
jgi:hypothetical protein